jgi:hypothetical protein
MGRCVILLTCALSLLSFKAHATFTSGNELLQDCGDRSGGGLVCSGYIEGVIDGADTVAAWNKLRGNCMSPSVAVGQLTLVFEKYAREHPEVLHFSAASILLNAIGEAFPCK